METVYFQIFFSHIFRNWLFLSVEYSKSIELGFYKKNFFVEKKEFFDFYRFLDL